MSRANQTSTPEIAMTERKVVRHWGRSKGLRACENRYRCPTALHSASCWCKLCVQAAGQTQNAAHANWRATRIASPPRQLSGADSVTGISVVCPRKLPRKLPTVDPTAGKCARTLVR